MKRPKTKPKRLESWLLDDPEHHFKFPNLDRNTYFIVFAVIAFFTILSLYILHAQ